MISTCLASASVDAITADASIDGMPCELCGRGALVGFPEFATIALECNAVVTQVFHTICAPTVF